jgi:hypothetical protein
MGNAQPWGRGYLAGAARTEGELIPCSTEPHIPIKNHHESPVYRRLSGIIGFEISFGLSRAKPFSSPGGEDQGEGELFPCSMAVWKDSSVPVISPGSNFSSVKWPSAKTHKPQTSPLCDARSHKSHIKSLNVTDSEPKPLFYSSTKGSSFYSVQWPSAKTPQSFRLSFVLFAFFVVTPLFNSAFRNRLCVHGAPDFLRNFEIFDFHFQTKNRPLSRSNLVTQGSNSLIKNHCGLLQRLTTQKSCCNAHETPVYRALLEIIGFEFPSLTQSSLQRPSAKTPQSRFIPASSHKNRTTKFSGNHSQITSRQVVTTKIHNFPIAHPPPLSIFK